MCSQDDNNSPNSSEDDLITLGELTEYENMVWQFPDTKRCPVRSCGMLFATRAKAIVHYRENHSQHAVLCVICNYPLMLLTAAHHLAGHYRRIHPGITPPEKVKFSRPECSLCGVTFKNYVYLNNHMRNVHHGKKKKTHKRRATKGKRNKKPNRASTTFKPSVKSDKMTVRSNSKSPSWEDMETDVSTSVDGTSETADDSHGTSIDSTTQAKTNSLRQLVTRKASSFIPQNKSRPCTICGRNLKNYVLACSHYRAAHGRTVSMCPICHKYFTRTTTLIQHMVKFHEIKRDTGRKMAKKNQHDKKEPKTKTKSIASNDKTLKNGSLSTTTNELNTNESSFTTNESSLVTNESNSAVQIDEPMEVSEAYVGDVAEDDFILLGEMTEYPTLRWQFPDTKSCPRTNCKQKFKTRAEAIKHYRDIHSNYDVLCKECNVLVSLTGAHNLINHYKRIHPSADLPAKSEENKIACHACQKVLSFQQMRIHMFTKHKESSYTVPSKVKGDDRIHKRKSLYLKRTESKQTRISVRAMLRSKSVCHLGHSASFTSPLQTDDHDQSIEHTSDPPREVVTPKPGQKTNSNDLRKLSSTESVSELSTRSTRIRNKACTICGMVLLNYVAACEHYNRAHGRNVLMCPYCEKYFLQSHLLTKHVLGTHSKDSVIAAKVVTPISATARDEQENLQTHDIHDADMPDAANQDNEMQVVDIPDTHSHTIEAPVSDAIPPMQPVELTVKGPVRDQDEPLNLTVSKNNGQEIVDLSSGALDLSLKK